MTVETQKTGSLALRVTDGAPASGRPRENLLAPLFSWFTRPRRPYVPAHLRADLGLPPLEENRLHVPASLEVAILTLLLPKR